MMNFIAKLQKMSEFKRRQVLLVTTTLITLFVVVLWGAAFYTSLVHRDAVATENSASSTYQVLEANLSSAKNTFNF